MPVGFNPYQIAQLYSQPQKERQKLAQDERSSIGFEANYKKKMAKELENVLQKLKEDADKRSKKNKKGRKALDFFSNFDPTGLVSGASDYLGAKDMKEGLKLMNTSPSLSNYYKNSFLDEGLKDYNKDVTKSWRGINTGKAFAQGALLDFASKKLGADGDSNRMKFSDFGDLASSFKEGYMKNKAGENLVSLFDNKGLFSNIGAGMKNILSSQSLGPIEDDDFKGSILEELTSKFGGSESTPEGQKQLIMLLNNLLGGDEYSMSGNFRDYFGN